MEGSDIVIQRVLVILQTQNIRGVFDRKGLALEYSPHQLLEYLIIIIEVKRKTKIISNAYILEFTETCQSGCFRFDDGVDLHFERLSNTDRCQGRLQFFQ